MAWIAGPPHSIDRSYAIAQRVVWLCRPPTASGRQCQGEGTDLTCTPIDPSRPEAHGTSVVGSQSGAAAW